MDLENATPFIARLLRMLRSEDQMQATLVLKSTFERDAFGRLVPAASQMPMVDDPLQTPFGTFHSDCYVRKDGVDLCVLGTVRPERSSRVVQLELTVGSIVSGLTVFGDRQWIAAGGGLIASEPLPFDESPRRDSAHGASDA
jgi:hypothetical protein